MDTELKIDKAFSNNIIAKMEEMNIDYLVLGLLLDLKPASVSDLLSGKSSWKLKHVYKISRFLQVKTDELIYGDENYIEKEKIKGEVDLRNYVRAKLIKEKKYKQLGQLEANGYFNLLKVAESSPEYQPTKKK